MRFIHTADWHLGRLFHGLYLTDDQTYILDQMVELAREEKADAVLIAGDVYDRAIPPADAVRLLDDVLSRLILDVQVTVILIAGNHDSPNRLDFGSRLMAPEGLHIVGKVRTEGTCVTLQDSWGPVDIYPAPFIDSASFGTMLNSEENQDQRRTFESYLEWLRANKPSKRRSVLVSHAFVSGGETSDSERPTSVGGADQIDPTSFRGFNYVALGHLHRPQIVGGEQARYAGSLLKYSFSEANHHKSVTVVELDEHGSCEVSTIALTPRRDVRKIEGFLKDVLAGPKPGENREDYIMATILDTEAILDVMGKLRQVYPNVLHIERPHFAFAGEKSSGGKDCRKHSDLELFAAFFKESTGHALTQEQSAAYESIVEELRSSQREALA